MAHRLIIGSQEPINDGLLRELIADCLGPALGPTFETHVNSFMNKGHVVKNATKLPAL